MVNFKSRIINSFPVFSQLLKNTLIKTGNVTGGVAGDLSVVGIKPGDEIISVVSVGGNVQTVATGAVAGDVAVTGIKADDVLKSVINLSDGTDITSEFSITADGKINNAEGATTATDTLLVVWERPKSDMSSEFVIKSDGVINNTSGTPTTGMTLMVTWLQWADR